MTYKNKYLVAGLLIVAVALGAKWLYTQQSQTSVVPVPTAPTADEIFQQELAVAQRICEKAKIIAAGSEPPITLEECLEENARCENQLGPHAVWTGPAPGGFPTCACDENYHWVNNDGTTGVSYGEVTLNVIGGPGKCVARQ